MSWGFVAREGTGDEIFAETGHGFEAETRALAEYLIFKFRNAFGL